MYGALIGDIAGSFYEVLELEAYKNKKVRSYMERVMIMDKDVPLFTKNSSCTDDSILTVAIADAILSNTSYKEKLKEYGLRELELGFDIYNRKKFSSGFIKWLNGCSSGKSYGNGCAMRISPIGFLFNDINKIKLESYKATIPSHNHPNSIKASEAVALSIYLLRNGISKEELKNFIEKNYFSLNYNLIDLRMNYKFTSEVLSSVPQAIYCFLNSTDFEDAIRNAISIGGDSDTIATIVGSLAESYYGISEELIEKVKPYIKEYMKPVLNEFYELNNNKQYIKK